MGKSILYFGEDRFVEWTTVSDSPTTWIMTEAELRDYVRDEYGRQGMADLDERIRRAREHGTSARIDTLESLLANNHAGRNGSRLDLEGILFVYSQENAPRLHADSVVTQPEPDGTWAAWRIGPGGADDKVHEQDGFPDEDTALAAVRAQSDGPSP